MLLLLALLSLRLAGALLSPPPLSAPPPPDLILSSGFLAFARQAGVIEALQDKGVALGRIVGTSSGALAGSMLAAGYSGEAIGKELSRRRPIQLFSLGRRMHRGLFSLSGLQAHMSTLLPKDFKDLKYPLAVGTYATSTGRFELVTDGDLCAAVAASCAIPYIFQPVM
ncbi:acyl transferase/acyl hydrolase/lysophospholipase, partial [Ochromonadaceae sp. CCMP2298]